MNRGAITLRLQGWWNQLLLWLGELRARLRVYGLTTQVREKEVLVAVERVVDQANPRLRGLMGYKRRLAPVVDELLDYGNRLLSEVPGPFTVDEQAWANDPLVNALFGNIDTMRRILSGREVRDWVRANPQPPRDTGDCSSAGRRLGGDGSAASAGRDYHPHGGCIHALLLAVPEYRKQFGTELVGEYVHRDVKRTTLSFKERQIFGVGADMPEVRRALKPRIVDLIVSISLSRIVAQEERMAGLEESLRMLKLRMKVIDPRVRGLDLVLGDSTGHLAEQARLQARIGETERELTVASRGLSTVNDYLARLIAELQHPEEELSLERVPLWLDRMNVVREHGYPGAREVVLARTRRADRPGRIALYIRFPRRLVNL